MLKDLIDKYAWVNDIEAWTIAVVTGRSADEILGIYGGDPTSPVGDYFFAQTRDLQGGGYPEPLRFHLQTLSHGDHVVVIENNGWSGSVPEIARRCSAHDGHFFSVYWNVNAFGMLVEAIDGKITAHFESLYPISSEPPQPDEVRPPWSIGPDTETGTARPTCLALMEQQTGLAVEQHWLTTPLPTYRIPDPDEWLREVADARSAILDALLHDSVGQPGALPGPGEFQEQVQDTDRTRRDNGPDELPEPGDWLFRFPPKGPGGM